MNVKLPNDRVVLIAFYLQGKRAIFFGWYESRNFIKQVKDALVPG